MIGSGKEIKGVVAKGPESKLLVTIENQETSQVIIR